eukprot:TRINITY_DN3900_c0_g1_i17.p1 TRINITY_DN3900_c0_g1~~TRINITY_DN3900_c0_g1_i17.p1  ORF type:complete len:452 (+),score=70.09 TRINITY_DN3900_c0_g1_i17:27-1358(+)
MVFGVVVRFPSFLPPQVVRKQQKQRPIVCNSVGQVEVISDTNVPEGHQSLHGFLYDADTESVHNINSDSLNKYSQEEDDGEVLISIERYLNERENVKQLSVFGVYDANKNLQYVGYSRNTVGSLRGILSKVGNERCAFLRTKIFRDKRMASRSVMEEEAQKWIDQADSVPPGNSVESELWSGNQGIVRKLSEIELEEYEMLKLKMKKAMGESLNKDTDQESEQAKIRRLKTIQAVEGDNWSAVISQQTEQTLQQSAEGLREIQKQPEPRSEIVTPFANAKVQESLDDSDKKFVELTKANVDSSLEQVRPYLIADGGNVEVVDVLQNGDVVLQLQGACIGCPSSSATIKMGIQRSLRGTFGGKIREIIALEGDATEKVQTTQTIIDQHLDSLRSAISMHGASVETLGFQNGICEIKYNGPEAISQGIVAALKTQFPDIQQVVMK